MSLLTDTDIAALLNSTSNWIDKDNSLHIYPFDPESLTPVGYDLRIGKRYVSAVHGGPSNVLPGESIPIDPGETVLIETLERVDLPQNRTISALVASKLTVVSRGFSHISTTIDPDWQGELLIAMTNHGRETLRLKHSEAFCTVVFFQNKSPSTKPIGKVPGRTDVLLTLLAEQARRKQSREGKQKRIERLMIVIPFVIVMLFIIGGYIIFRTGVGFTAALGAGVVLAEAFFLYLRSKYG